MRLEGLGVIDRSTFVGLIIVGNTSTITGSTVSRHDVGPNYFGFHISCAVA